MELSIKNLTKKYSRDKFGLQDFSLVLNSGITGLLGPNGAGKSTLMRIIATITKPSQGQILLNGKDIAKDPNSLRQILGYLPQDFGVYPNLNALEFLEYIAAIKGLSGKNTRMRIEALLDELNLSHAKKKPIGTYSGGMKQRIGIAQVLLNDPKLLIFDEPTVGLDPEERVRFRNLLSHLSGERIVILSSHIVSDIETTAANIVIMNDGRLLEHDATHHIAQAVAGKVFEGEVPDEAFDSFKESHIISNTMRRPNGSWLVRYIGDASGNGGTEVKASVEDAYLWFVKSAKKGASHD
ncbi:MAG: ABC transporter ATP-binding protein [bacterium]|nr:ABC transporter ATP-binding protein [bacterium]